jgi:hypothetical protein
MMRSAGGRAGEFIASMRNCFGSSSAAKAALTSTVAFVRCARRTPTSALTRLWASDNHRQGRRAGHARRRGCKRKLRQFGWSLLPRGSSRRPLILISRRHASVARRARPPAHATLQYEAEAAWYDRLSSDLLWRGLFQPGCAKTADQKQVGRACYAARGRLFERQPGKQAPQNRASHARTSNGRLVVLRQSIVAACQLRFADSPGSLFPIGVPLAAPDESTFLEKSAL